MAVPKRKKSKSKSRSRRAVYMRIKVPSLVRCKNCGGKRVAHSICEVCGYYKGRLVLKVKL